MARTSKVRPRTQAAPSGGPPRPPKKTARDLEDDPGEPPKNAEPPLEVGLVGTNALMAWAELLVLNGRGPLAKHEELERTLDRNILALKKFTEKKMKKKDRKKVLETLRCIHEYRLCFPRIKGANGRLSERAQEVLEQF